MEDIIKPIDRELIIAELTADKLIGETRKGGNFLYEVTAFDSPNIMKEIGRLREIAFREGGGGTGKSMDIDEFDIDETHPYKQLIVWDPENQEIMGGYRYHNCKELPGPEKLATSELFRFSDKFMKDYFPRTIELGRSFVQPMYQRTALRRKGLFAMDNLWDGLGALIVKNPDILYFFGKVTMYKSYNLKARNILLNYMNRYLKDNENLVEAIEPLSYDENNPEYTQIFEGLDSKEGYKVTQKLLKDHGEFVPPLINSYINVSPSMKVFGTADNVGFGGVEETGILITIEDMFPEKTDRHILPFREKLKTAKESISNWWKRRPLRRK